MKKFFRKNLTYVLLIDERMQYRKDLEEFLMNKKIMIAGSFIDADSVLENKSSTIPHVAIVEFIKDKDTTAAIIKRLKERYPEIKIIINNPYTGGFSYQDVTAIDVQALIYRDISSNHSIAKAIKAVIEGRTFCAKQKTNANCPPGEFSELLRIYI